MKIFLEISSCDTYTLYMESEFFEDEEIANAFFCRSCSKTILSEFLYCPYCVLEQENGNEMIDIVEESFSKIEKVQAEGCLSKLDELSEILNNLEVEINQILEQKIEKL